MLRGVLGAGRLGAKTFKHTPQYGKIDRFGYWFGDVELQGPGEAQDLAQRLVIAAANHNDRRRAAGRGEMAEQRHSAAAIAERDIERDTIERALLRKLHRFAMVRRADRMVAGLGRRSANDHAMKVIIVDDEEPRRTRRVVRTVLLSFIRHQRLSTHPNRLILQ